jgi:DNA-binding transcriptional LysR family regulator
MDRFDCLQAFVRVAETESFAETARQLGLSPSAVTKRISHLEERLGVQLLRRTTRSVRATELGCLFYERAVELVTLMQEAEGIMHQERIEVAGQLRISSPTSFGMMHLSPALCTFQGQHPALQLEVILSDRGVNPIEEGFDVCLLDVGPRQGSMVERRLFPLRRVVCAAPTYVAAHGAPGHPRELSQHACIHYSYLESGQTWRFEASEGPIAVTIHPSFSTNNGRIMLEAALEGKGIAVLPTFLAVEELKRGDLVVLLSDFTFATLYLSAIYPRRKHLPSKVRLLLDFLAERFGPEPPWDRELMDSQCMRVAEF